MRFQIFITFTKVAQRRKLDKKTKTFISRIIKRGCLKTPLSKLYSIYLSLSKDWGAVSLRIRGCILHEGNTGVAHGCSHCRFRRTVAISLGLTSQYRFGNM